MKQIKTFITNWPGDNDKEINEFLAKVKNPKITPMINKSYYVVMVEFDDSDYETENSNPYHYAKMYELLN